ncbi:MAG TPA: alpha/beta fold hydrolase [Steroidobacteraceae bacterium]
MANDALSFRPTGLLRSGHLQTLLSSLWPLSWLTRRRAAALRTGARELLLDCDDGVRLQAWVSAGPPPVRRVALLLHGWEGSAEATYLLSLGSALLARGYEVVRLNLRDHGATHHLNREIFHSCRLAEVIGAVRDIARRYPQARLYLAGFSLGGNFLLRVAAAARAPKQIAGVVAVSPVLDPDATLTALERGWLIYRRSFVRRWSRSLRRKQRAWPGVHDFGDMLRLAQLRGMTAGLVVRCTAFPDLAAYLNGYAITGSRLSTLRFPARVLLAEDDPIVPAADLTRLAASPLLKVERSRYGGHCGFAGSLSGPSWADRYVLSQFDEFDESSALTGARADWECAPD